MTSLTVTKLTVNSSSINKTASTSPNSKGIRAHLLGTSITTEEVKGGQPDNATVAAIRNKVRQVIS
ncbi:unnamed protein product [Protopolystoma xenopodis]|uniref:Uncharacterized protein n=1 Tax=Protopolystoma xenopodis TaxID=117903 RepID=A0A3S5AK23_9PLAT|nr:unnamed protein product [Protopolystoma xenopodis]